MKRCSFFFNDTATTEIYTLSLHDALPINLPRPPYRRWLRATGNGFARAYSACPSRLPTLTSTESASSPSARAMLPRPPHPSPVRPCQAFPRPPRHSRTPSVTIRTVRPLNNGYERREVDHAPSSPANCARSNVKWRRLIAPNGQKCGKNLTASGSEGG